MPALVVYGIPEEAENVSGMLDKLRKAVESIPEMGITGDNVSVFLPRDLLTDGLGEEIIIFVDGLFVKPERTEEVRNRYAQVLGEIAKVFFPEALIEVFVRSFEPTQGFWTSESDKPSTVDPQDS